MDPIVFNPSSTPPDSGEPPKQPSDTTAAASADMPATPDAPSPTPDITPATAQPAPVPIQPTAGPASEMLAGSSQVAPSSDSLAHASGKPLFASDSGSAPVGQPSLPGPYAGSMPVAPVPIGSQLKGAKKSRLMIIGGGLLGVVIIAGVVFGYVLPSRPSAVWATGLNRSGKALSKLVESATEKSALETAKKSHITASLTANYDDLDISGSFDSKFDPTSANGGIKVTAKANGQAEKNYSLNFMGELSKGHTFPTAYFQFNGIKALGLDAYNPVLGTYDGKWIEISEDFYTLLGVDPETASNKNQLTADDIAEVARAATAVTSERVFTTDTTKAVFERRKTFGKEKVDNISAYHYKVGINKPHLGDYCAALIDKLVATKAYKKLPESATRSVTANKEEYKKSCRTSANDIKDTDTFDLWVDAKYKLVYKVRFVDDKNAKTYVDVGQLYKGGDDISLFIRSHDEEYKEDGSFTLATNIKSHDTKAEFTITSKGSSPYNVKANFEAKPYSGTIDTTAPAGVIKIEQLMKDLGYDPSLLSAVGRPSATYDFDSSSAVTDTERKTDINAMHGQLEAYYAQNGFYPSLANLNDPNWRVTNMKGLDPDAVKPLDSNSTGYAVSASADQYGYDPTGCNSAGQCQRYVLAALLSAGDSYIKNSLN